MSSVLDKLRVCFTVRLVGDFFVNRRATVLDNRLENHERVESSVGVWGEHFLLDLLNGIFGAGKIRKIRKFVKESSEIISKPRIDLFTESHHHNIR